MSEFYRALSPGGHLIFSVHHPFMNFYKFKRENYFKTELLTDEWHTHKGNVEVQFYRRPLSYIIGFVITAGFTIENVLEPMPTEEFRKNDSTTYEKLTKKPQFLFIRAKK